MVQYWWGVKVVGASGSFFFSAWLEKDQVLFFFKLNFGTDFFVLRNNKRKKPKDVRKRMCIRSRRRLSNSEDHWQNIISWNTSLSPSAVTRTPTRLLIFYFVVRYFFVLHVMTHTSFSCLNIFFMVEVIVIAFNRWFLLFVFKTKY